MNFTSKDYLPNSEEKINHLRKIIDGRPVAILAAGPSISELEKRIGELSHADICYFGLNNFSVQEAHILQQIGKHLSVMMNSARENIPRFMKDIIDFLNRDEDNMFVSSFWRDAFGLLDSDFDRNQFLSKYDRKCLFFSLSYERTVPNRNHPLHFTVGNSLQILIQLAMIGKASRIVLFGADGYSKENSENQYYCQREYSPLSGQEALIYDTNTFFNPIMPIAIRNVYKTYNLAPIDIFNCSKDSFYTPFPIVTYDDAFEYLLTGKKYNRKSDLRVPKVSIISPLVNTGDLLKETVENISNQSYSNHEHIIVYGEADDEMRDMMRQFPHVRLITEKNIEYLQGFRKGISMARGEYICYCPVSNLYANPDWLNICMEILENHPDISLVWGLCQHVSETGAPGRITNAKFFDNPPPQGKDFIYYWLKKKIIFPEGNFCVRKGILEECFPFHDSKVSDEREAWLSFNYRFNTSGYLPFFVPVVANFHRTYGDPGGHRPLVEKGGVTGYLPYYVPLTANSDAEGPEAIVNEGLSKIINSYYNDIKQYKKLLIKGKIIHRYRNGIGEALPDYFNRNLFFFYDIQKYAKKKLPNKWLLVCEKTLSYWRKYRWSIFKVGTIDILHRLIKIWVQKRNTQFVKKQR